MTEDTSLREKALRDEHERIWLEPFGAPDRCWCQDNVWGDEAVEYVRSDLVDAKDRRIEALEAALKRLLDRDERNTCQHEDTHRGGFLWTICDGCGAKWADDEGGKPDWQDPQEWVQARAALSGKEGQS